MTKTLFNKSIISKKQKILGNGNSMYVGLIFNYNITFIDYDSRHIDL